MAFFEEIHFPLWVDVIAPVYQLAFKHISSPEELADGYLEYLFFSLGFLIPVVTWWLGVNCSCWMVHVVAASVECLRHLW